MKELTLEYRGRVMDVAALRAEGINVIAVDDASITVRGFLPQRLIAEAVKVTDADGKVVKQREP